VQNFLNKNKIIIINLIFLYKKTTLSKYGATPKEKTISVPPPTTEKRKKGVCFNLCLLFGLDKV
jgi:hypothetical protein